jgi:hypothetical protein
MRNFKTCKLHQMLLNCEEHVARRGEMTNAYQISILKPEGKRLLERLKRRCENYIKIEPREIGWECVEWIHLVQDRSQWRTLVNTVMNLRPYKAVNLLTS